MSIQFKPRNTQSGGAATESDRPDSDVDLCLVAEGAAEQLKAAHRWRVAISEIRPKPAFSLLPIAPQRLQEKQTTGDYFFQTVMKEGVQLAA